MLPDATTALLVIDAQESFRHRPYFEEDELDSYLLNQQALITGAQQAGIPVVQVLHVEPEGAFSEASGLVRTLAPLKLSPEFVVRKERHSALVGSGLDVWLVQRAVQRLIISGIRTEQCCETTTRHASDLGYQVDFCTEATATFPMIDKAGHRWSSAEIKARSELVLEGRFARIVTVR
ncbi:MAG: isochorismatase family protein, partial [Hyphomonadaceae bacterium]|nr:isochorismatase family protein [Hyphomonadaceae bacterium]